MTDGKLNSFLMELRNAFLDRQWDMVVDAFQLPMVVYSEAGVTLFRDRAHLLRVLQEYQAALATNEIASTTMDVEHRDTPFNQRFRATVRITDFSEEGIAIRQSLIRYFLLEDGDSYKVEMLEYIQSSLPLSEVERIVH